MHKEFVQLSGKRNYQKCINIHISVINISLLYFGKFKIDKLHRVSTKLLQEMPYFKNVVDVSRADNIDYVLQDEICKYLCEIRYREGFESMLKDGVDPQEILKKLDRKIFYQCFRDALLEISANKESLKIYVRDHIVTDIIQKVYIQETCVVCLEKPSRVILECSHQILCNDCFETLKKLRNTACPLCRNNFNVFIYT